MICYFKQNYKIRREFECFLIIKCYFLLLLELFSLATHQLQETYLCIHLPSAADEGMPNLSSGDENVAIGDEALKANTSGSNNTAVGDEALKANTSGQKNTAIGKNSLYSNTNGQQNVLLALRHLKNNTSGRLQYSSWCRGQIVQIHLVTNKLVVSIHQSVMKLWRQILLDRRIPHSALVL